MKSIAKVWDFFQRSWDCHAYERLVFLLYRAKTRIKWTNGIEDLRLNLTKQNFFVFFSQKNQSKKSTLSGNRLTNFWTHSLIFCKMSVKCRPSSKFINVKVEDLSSRETHISSFFANSTRKHFWSQWKILYFKLLSLHSASKTYGLLVDLCSRIID